MPMFMCLLNWTEQGIRSIKEAPKRAKAAQELAKKVGVDIKEVYLTSGDSDLLVILDTPNGECRQIRACDQLARTRAYPHRSHLAAIRVPEADIGAAVAGASDLEFGSGLPTGLAASLPGISASKAARERASPGNPSAFRKAFRAEDGCAHQRVHALV